MQNIALIIKNVELYVRNLTRNCTDLLEILHVSTPSFGEKIFVEWDFGVSYVCFMAIGQKEAE